MRVPQRKLIEALDRVEQFLNEYAPLLEGTVQPGARQAVSNVRDSLVAYAGAQNVHDRNLRLYGATVRKLTKILVRDHMRPIAHAATVLGGDSESVAALTIPQSWKARHMSIIQAANGLATVARQNESMLLSGGLLSPGFVDELLAAIAALEEAVGARSQALGNRVAATTGLAATTKKAHQLLPIVEAQVRRAVGDETVLARWSVARRIHRVIAAPRRLALSAGGQQAALPAKAPELLLLPAGPTQDADVRAAAEARAMPSAESATKPDIEQDKLVGMDRDAGPVGPSAATRAVRRRVLSGLMRFFSRAAPE